MRTPAINSTVEVGTAYIRALPEFEVTSSLYDVIVTSKLGVPDLMKKRAATGSLNSTITFTLTLFPDSVTVTVPGALAGVAVTGVMFQETEPLAGTGVAVVNPPATHEAGTSSH